MFIATVHDARRLRRRGAAALLVASLCCALLSGSAFAAAPATAALRTVRYRGYVVRIPRSWPVFNLARDPATCVRFNRHALYLGVPSPTERCPAKAVGRTEAILIAPLSSASSATALGIAGNTTSFSVPAHRLEVTATWSRAKGLVAAALGRRSLPQVSPIKGGGSSRATSAPAAIGGAQAPVSTAFAGYGFDTCMAPTTAQMSAWKASPYRAVGIYIGGTNAGCSEPNLSKTWVAAEIAAGWHLMPIYVGLQAPSNGCGCTSISKNTAKATDEGQAAATEAVQQAQHYGLPAKSPIYDDMEGYARGKKNSSAVLAFLAGWSTKLRSYGYLAGVYSSSDSGITDLVDQYGTSYPEPNDIWIANWNGKKNTNDPNVPGSDWPDHQRLHQYAGNNRETYNKVTLDVDEDYLDGATAATGDGYLILTSDGGVHPYGRAKFYGSDAGKLPVGVTAVGIAKDRKTGGYWILKSDGGVDSFHAPWEGSLKGKLNGSGVVSIVAAPEGGYLILTSHGGVHPFGGAKYHGSAAHKLGTGVTPIGLAMDRSTGGYWLLKSNGGVDSFDAPWEGSLIHKLGKQRVVSIATGAPGGYLILSSAGGVHPFGAAKYYGSDRKTMPTGASAVALATEPPIVGYRILRSDGGVDPFDATWDGSMKDKIPAGMSVVSIVAAAIPPS